MKKSLLMLTILSVSLCFNGLAFAEGFTNASFQGHYSMRASLGPTAAALGEATADGDGNVSGTGIENHPVLNQRMVIPVDMEGTYTVNENGTGTVTYTVGAYGISNDLIMDIVIMDAEVVNGVKLATEVFGIPRGSGRTVATFTMKRLPD